VVGDIALIVDSLDEEARGDSGEEAAFGIWIWLSRVPPPLQSKVRGGA
jgi:hypothetical protein